MRLAYLSQGNVPSRWAHTFQAMKMAEALAPLVADFRLVTQAHWTDFLRPRFDYESWYGIRRPFPIVRLPALRAARRWLAEAVHDRRFDRLAAAYLAWQRPDCVFTRSVFAGRLCVERGLRTMVETHNTEQSADLRILRSIAGHPKLAGVVTVTEPLRESYVAAGIPQAKIMVWPDAVDPLQFRVDADTGALRRRLSLASPAPVAAYVGHLYPHKGVQYVVDAARLVPEVNFVIIGGWPADIELLKERAKGLANLVVAGFVPHSKVPQYMAAADVVLLPNSAAFPEARTTSPLKLFEYMASHRPIIASGIPAFRRLLTNGVNAIVVEPDSAPALAAAVRRLAGDAVLCRRLADQAWNDVQAFTWEKRAAAVLDFAASEAP